MAVIQGYRHLLLLFSPPPEKSCSAYLNYLGYHLTRNGQAAEALPFLERSITLGEQGYCNFGALATAYGDMSQALMELGRFEEALLFDEKAMTEIQRCADAGNVRSQEDIWTYLVNRGRLYLRLGRIDEAEKLLRESIPHIHLRRRIYQMFAEDALDEIKEWRRTSSSSHYQIDWRWVDRYRDLAAFDSFWWLAAAGPFSEEEQRQWDQSYAPDIDEMTKEQLGRLIAQSRQRELDSAIAKQRQPHFHYPALAIDEVRSHINGLLQLDSEIQAQESHPLVRRIYHDTIDEELDFLRLIEATYERNTERFWFYNVRTIPSSTEEEMTYALSRVRQMLLQGLRFPETTETSEQLVAFMRNKLYLSLDLSVDDAPILKRPVEAPASPAQATSQQTLSSLAAKRFFATVLRESGFDGWQVVIDPTSNGARIEQGLRRVFVGERAFTVEYIKHLLSHELAGHVTRCEAGRRSLLGLLGIHSKNSLVVEEGLALYYDRQAAGRPSTDVDFTIWIATLATGLGSDVLVPPQKFLATCSFLEWVYTLYQLLYYPTMTMEKAQRVAHSYALSLSMRTYGGVPDLEEAGVCYTQDALYLRGLWLIERAIAQDTTILDRLAVGVVGMEYLPEIEELGITASPVSLRNLLGDPELDAYIRSFEAIPDSPIGQEQK